MSLDRPQFTPAERDEVAEVERRHFVTPDRLAHLEALSTEWGFRVEKLPDMVKEPLINDEHEPNSEDCVGILIAGNLDVGKLYDAIRAREADGQSETPPWVKMFTLPKSDTTSHFFPRDLE